MRNLDGMLSVTQLLTLAAQFLTGRQSAMSPRVIFRAPLRQPGGQPSNPLGNSSAPISEATLPDATQPGHFPLTVTRRRSGLSAAGGASREAAATATAAAAGCCCGTCTPDVDQREHKEV